MQKLLFFFVVAVIAISCNNEKSSEPVKVEGVKIEVPAAVALPYTPTYSSSFEPGNMAYAASILKGSWKDWENNTMDNMQEWAADSIVAFLSDNSIVQGVDSLKARWKRLRSGYTAVIDSVNGVTSLYSTDKKENWVLVWATEYNTNANGSKDTSTLMETWRINKDGKADMLLQYDRAKRKK